ncbi:N-acetyltransferase family protein [Lutimonas saemankumensis]|uniref:GNAT family N-acetyltransferase n=1 Tax=Lutimonas saemankumensis TaxID=483016 RepID=UPI001CD3B6D3|nr:GNAT family N-acetyltransferase [Lutimonas saemankumensis]MCA0932745.1 N-acetyltransferase family protein [Lutimonas saemankumensis]
MIRTEAINYSHWPEVSRIYEEGIATGMATFEKEIPSWEAWDANHLKSCRIIARNNEEVLGWAALSPVSSRCVYGGVAEVSVYVAANARGKGIGKILMNRLITESESEGFWTLQAGIFPENKNSIRLHEKSGFRIIGFRERIGLLDGVWKDNVLLERRSSKIGL